MGSVQSAGRETLVKNKFSKSIGTGLGSLTRGGREFYVLEYKSNSGSYQAGQQKEIIVDYIEMGRDPSCAIRFSEEEQTVSRRHAAINKEGDDWVLLNLSQLNPTLLNGRPVNSRYYLSSGDEIQLSLEGPRLGFIIPANNKTGSLSIGRRMSLFREQALRPYKRALAGLAVLVLLVALGAAFLIFQLRDKNLDLQATLDETQKAFQDSISISAQRADSLQLRNEALLKESEVAQNRIRRLNRQMRQLESNQLPPPAASGGQAAPTRLSGLYKDVYHVQVSNLSITANEEVIELDDFSWSGTGFLTNDNRFITARHVVEPWFYPTDPEEDSDMVLINIMLNNYGAEISMDFQAISTAGERITLDYRAFNINRANDIPVEVELEEQPHVVRHALNNPNDIAWARINREGGLLPGPQLSENLPAARQLTILGYPLNLGSNPDNMAPLYMTAAVARPGLENGSIVTNSRMEHGYSGGPVFIEQNGQYVVVGVVSGGWGQSIGRIVPLSSIY